MNIPELAKDPHSFARPEFARVTDIYLELNVNFVRRVLEGKAILTIERTQSAHQVVLDSNKLKIKRVRNFFAKPEEEDLKYCIVKTRAYGHLFAIELPQTVDVDYNDIKPKCKIQIEYETNPYTNALRWLNRSKTADGSHFFLLSNTKHAYARAIFPCQDTPSVKFTYTAKILVPKEYTVLMSAHLQKISIHGPDHLEYEFHQMNMIPSYAVVIAVGKLEKRQHSARSTLYAENKYITDCIRTFRSVTIESMLQIAESLCGPYLWGRFDVCVLPPCIADLEVQSPCVTFISPTLLRGDCTIISSLALNISKNWAGYLVTCANYNHLWLNNSLSTFIARKIVYKLLVDEEAKCFIQTFALNEVRKMIEKCTDIGSIRCLLPNLISTSPRVATRNVPYEVGCILLDHLENIFGSSMFESYFKSYFLKFAYKSITTKDWKNYLYEHFADKNQELDGIPWTSWFCEVFPPPVVTEITSWEKKCYRLAGEWIKWNGHVCDIPSILLDRKDLCDIQKILLINNLYCCHTNLTVRKLQFISIFYSFGIQSGEIRFAWLLLCVKIRWWLKFKVALDYAIEFSSPNFSCPMFEHLYEWEEMRSLVIATYMRNENKILPVTRGIIRRILHLN